MFYRRSITRGDLPSDMLVRKYMTPEFESLDVQLLWNMLFKTIFQSLTLNRSFEIPGILKIKCKRMLPTQLMKKKMPAGREYYYAPIIILDEAIKYQYTDFINGDDDSAIMIPEETEISEWAIYLIKKNSWLQKDDINHYIKLFFQNELLRLRLGPKFQYMGLVINVRLNSNHIYSTRQKYPKIARLGVIHNDYIISEYTDKVISVANSQIMY